MLYLDKLPRAILVILMLCLICMSSELLAQCPMCRMTAESNLKHGGTAGQGLNNGILFLLSTPYIIIGTLAILYFKNKKEDAEI